MRAVQCFVQCFRHAQRETIGRKARGIRRPACLDGVPGGLRLWVRALARGQIVRRCVLLLCPSLLPPCTEGSTAGVEGAWGAVPMWIDRPAQRDRTVAVNARSARAARALSAAASGLRATGVRSPDDRAASSRAGRWGGEGARRRPVGEQLARRAGRSARYRCAPGAAAAVLHDHVAIGEGPRFRVAHAMDRPASSAAAAWPVDARAVLSAPCQGGPAPW